MQFRSAPCYSEIVYALQQQPPAELATGDQQKSDSQRGVHDNWLKNKSNLYYWKSSIRKP
jgi:hypothetical protein